MDSALSSIQVDTLIDENDGDLSIGDISLREALANVEEGGTITFAQSLAEDDVGAGRGVIALQEGQLVVDKSLSIEGLGADKLTVNGGGKSRVLVVGSAATIDGLTISGGIASNGTEEDRFDGGAILATGTGFELTIANSVITGNSSGIGSMTDSVYNTASSALTVENSIIDSNEGDGISPFFGKITITASSISNNLGNGVEGISIYGGSEVTIADSTIANNAGDAVAANGVFNSGIVMITGSTISGNGGAAAIASGGFRVSAGVINVSNSSIEDNDSGLYARGTTVESSTISGNRGVAVSSYRATVSSSSIINNSDVGIRGTFISVEGSTIAQNAGSGIFSRSSNSFPYDSSRLTINNSTISGNGGPDATVGGIYSDVRFSSELKITNTTITDNIGTEVGGILFEEAIPDEFDNSTQIEIANTIIANNQGPTPDLLSTNINSQGFNLIGDGTDTVGFVSTDIVGTRDNPIDPRLEPLQDNGGTTLTQKPLSGSPVIDAGSLDNDSNVSFDQRGRGFVRGLDGNNDGVARTDIGAIEVIPNRSVINGDRQNNRLISTDQADFMRGFAGNDRLVGRGGDDVLEGGAGNDQLLGGNGRDRLSGGSGNDKLTGGNGNDWLNGGAGNDLLRGNDGQDTFAFSRLSDGRDTIADFQLGIDKIDVSEIFSDMGPNSVIPPEGLIRIGQAGRRNATVSVLDIRPFQDSGREVFREIALVRNVLATELDASSFVL